MELFNKKEGIKKEKTGKQKEIKEDNRKAKINKMEKEEKTMIAMDSSMLLAIEEFKTDVFDEIKKMFGEKKVSFCITESVEKELNKLEKKNKRRKRQVSIAKELLEKNDVKVIKTNALKADDSLLEIAGIGVIVASNDKELRKRIKAFGRKNIYLRKKKFIEIE